MVRGATSYAYDAEDRLTAIGTPWGGQITQSYDVAGHPLRLAYPNGLDADLSFESATGRLAGIVHRPGSLGAPIAKFDHSYDIRGNLAALGELSGAKTFAYDPVERLTAVTKTTPAPATEVESYAYDLEGNRLVTHISPAYVTDDADQILDDGDNTYAWNAHGALISKTPKNGGAVSSFAQSWFGLTHRERLDSISGPVPMHFYYDAFDRLGSIVVDSGPGQGTLARYHDGPDPILEQRKADAGAFGQQWARYVHGPGADQPLAMEIYPAGAAPTPGTGAQYYFHADGEGSVRLLTDSAGQVANRYDYDSFGRRQTVVESAAQPFGWKGREFLPGPDIYYNRARFYDPLLGRFMSPDPIGYGGGDFNLYSFAWNSAVNWNDPSGLSATEAAGLMGLSPTDQYRRIACNLNTVFAKVALGLDGYTDLQSDGSCGATGTPPQSPKPPPPPEPPPPPCDDQPNYCPRQHNSFEAGTLVHTDKGLKPIETIAVGDIVLAKDEFTGENVLRSVKELFRRTAPGIARVTLQAEDGTHETTGVTLEHPLFVKGKGWTEVRLLSVGDEIVTSTEKRLKVAAIQRLSTPTLVYNLEIAQDHSYFVGTQEAWAHNWTREQCQELLRVCPKTSCGNA